MKSKFTQQDISSGRRLYNAWKKDCPDIDFWEYLNAETKKGFSGSTANIDQAPIKIVRS